MTFQDNSEQWPDALRRQLNSEVLDEDPSEQWFFQFHENLLLTVQAVRRLHLAMLARTP